MDGDEPVRALAGGGDARLCRFAPFRDGTEKTAEKTDVLPHGRPVAEGPGPAEEDAGATLPVEEGLFVHVDVPAAAVEAVEFEPERERPAALGGAIDDRPLRRDVVQEKIPPRPFEVAVVGPEREMPVGPAVLLRMGEEMRGDHQAVAHPAVGERGDDHGGESSRRDAAAQRKTRCLRTGEDAC